MKSHKFAFTLAELMIVLSVIGILSAILLPVAFQSTPDKDILKFKKANNTLATVVRELVSNEQYYKYGSLAYPVWASDSSTGDIVRDVGWTSGNASPGPIYFCKSFADVVSAKNVDCDLKIYQMQNFTVRLNISSAIHNAIVNNATDIHEAAKEKLDQVCQAILRGNFDIDTYGLNSVLVADNVLFYGVGKTFGISYASSEDDCYPGFEFPAKDPLGKLYCGDKNGNDYMYEPICMDIDGFDGPIKPFGFGIRSDGKILTGARADWWLKRDITKKETVDCCPAALGTSFTAFGITDTLCDEADTVCTE
ncbi:MAG: type II secretion system protein [Clostridia bacterium]|nr:type II secretion system protein [Candidatus Gastranaerophilales bacterium]MBQ4104271.1 type II secretion system protein [Clostridia bacterium]